GWPDNLQAERTPLLPEPHRNRNRGPPRQISRPAIAAHVLKTFVEAVFDGRRDLQKRRGEKRIEVVPQRGKGFDGSCANPQRSQIVAGGRGKSRKQTRLLTRIYKVIQFRTANQILERRRAFCRNNLARRRII